MFPLLSFLCFIVLAGCDAQKTSSDPLVDSTAQPSDLTQPDSSQQTTETGESVDTDGADDTDGQVDNSDTPLAGSIYDYLNQLRESAGMIPLTNNTELEKAAANHANYLVDNQQFGHGESASLPGFTGESVADRANHEGYIGRTVGEGISTGTTDFQAMDNLFSAIYHRFTLLDPESNEIGIGSVKQSTNSDLILVHNIGNNDLMSLCRTDSFSGVGAFYNNVCVDDTKVGLEAYDKVLLDTRNLNDQLIVWPPVNGVNIPPVFFEETPDPLPDYGVSGYPVSIELNTTLSQQFQLNSIFLFEDETNQLVDSTRLLDSISDPSELFTPLQYALFPLQRLNWNTTYRIEANYSIDDVIDDKVWKFTTQSPAESLITIEESQARFTVTSGVETAIYFPPTHPFDTLSNIRFVGPADASIDMIIFDGNTLLMTIDSAKAATVTISVNGDMRTIEADVVL